MSQQLKKLPRLEVTKKMTVRDHLKGIRTAIVNNTPFASQAGFFRHDEHLKRWEWFQCVHQPYESRSGGKFGTRDAVIRIHMLVADGPAFALGILTRVFDLACHAPLLVSDSVLFGGLSTVDGGNH